MRFRTAAGLGCMLAILPSSLAAQHDWSVELRAGAGVPTEDLGTVDLDLGFGSELTGGARVLEHLWLYAGWGYHRFETDAFLGRAEPYARDPRASTTVSRPFRSPWSSRSTTRLAN